MKPAHSRFISDNLYMHGPHPDNSRLSCFASLRLCVETWPHPLRISHVFSVLFAVRKAIEVSLYSRAAVSVRALRIVIRFPDKET